MQYNAVIVFISYNHSRVFYPYKHILIYVGLHALYDSAQQSNMMITTSLHYFMFNFM